MSHLLAISVGPVQEFIAAARRTRDLWFGSQLLSEISRAVAVSVEVNGGQLIFPHSICEAKNVANVILAELPVGNPKTIADEAEVAARKQWLEFALDAHQAASGVIRGKLPGEVNSIWDDQIDDVIEFYAAWVPHTDNLNYRADRAKLMRLLAGRKNCRDFSAARGRAGVPKSSLDGQRESVLKDPAKEHWPERFRARLRIREGEQLDVVGLVKRLAGGKQLYPSVSRIAADPWVRGNEPHLKQLRLECEELGNEVIRELNLNKERGHPHFNAFPFEGTAVYVNRHHELMEETGISQEELHDLRRALARLPEPDPYLAMLVADGDKMGAVISTLPNAKANRDFSEALASFADHAQRIVNKHNGVLVYAGGDDVLAFLPVDKCLGCARELRDKFVDLLSTYKNKEDESPTLSVGIAIGHFMENLEDLLEYGRSAEKAAKHVQVKDKITKKMKVKDALAVHLHKRGGAPIKVAARWETEPDTRLNRYAELIRLEAIPKKLPYDLRRLADVYENWPEKTLLPALQTDVLRVIRDKQPKADRSHMKEIEKLVQAQLTDAASVRRFSEELLVARQIFEALQQATVRQPRDIKVTS